MPDALPQKSTLIEFDCTGCWQSFDYDMDVAEKRLEKTTVHKPDRVSDVFVCPNCGSLLEPYLDGL